MNSTKIVPLVVIVIVAAITIYYLSKKTPTPTTFRYLRLTTGPTASEMCWREAQINKDGTNHALGGTITSSTPYNSSFKKEYINDGSTALDTYFHSLRGETQFIMIDTGKNLELPVSIKLFNRTLDNAQHRAVGVKVQLLDSSQSVVKEHVIETAMDEYTIEF
jgi:hypothetical protein